MKKSKLNSFSLSELKAEIKKRQMPSLKKQFKKAADKLKTNIETEVTNIGNSWELICEKADAAGIPLYITIHNQNIYYSPESFDAKWQNKVPREVVDELSGFSDSGDYEQSNWSSSSQYCY